MYVCVLLGYHLVGLFVWFLSVVLVCFPGLGAFVFVLGFYFLRKILKLGGEGEGEDLEELGGGEYDQCI